MINFLKRNGVLVLLTTIFQLAVSKIFFPKARIVRLPFKVRGMGNIIIGSGFSSNGGLVLETLDQRAEINIGSQVYVNYRLHVGAAHKVIIGDNTLIGSDCVIIDHDHGGYGHGNSSCPLTVPVTRELVAKPITIGKNVWIGDKTCILSGVTIGDGVVIGAGSIVTKNIPAYSLIVGNPAKSIKRYNFATKQWEPI